MRVGLYTDHLYRDGQVGTGTSKYIYHLIRELERLGVEIVPLRKGENPGDVDVLHDPHAPWNAPLFPRRPLLITIHDMTPFTHPQYYDPWIRFLYRQKLRWFSRRARRILVDSRRTADVVRDAVRPRLPVDVIHLGVEDRFRILPVGPPERPFLVQVGVHRAIKEPMTTLRAYEEIADRIPHDLHVVGSRGTLVEGMEAYVADRPPLRDRVKFYWPGEEGVPVVYNQSSLLVHPCPEEGFGFVPLEALACGAHVLAAAPAVQEVLGRYACYFEAPSDLGSRVVECLAKPPPTSREERARHAHSYTFRATAEATLRAYEAAS
ncbi:MAG TPA: glycosyltransferase [Thermoplasmata archaeon]|nr:glycosyltransferase [Thermoplasmata archaeon]